MKPITKSVLAGLLLLTAHGMSLAATTYTLHITGSTAFRSATHNAIVNYLFSVSPTHTNPTGAYKGSNISSANNAIFKGTIDSSGDVLIVETDWTGSAQGIYDTKQANPLANVWIDPSNAMSAVNPATAPSKITGGTSLASPVFAAAVAPDVTLSDTWQATTLFTTPALTEVVPNGVAVQAFVVCASAQSPIPVSGNAGTVTTAGSTVVSMTVPSAAGIIQPGYLVSGSADIPPFAQVVATNPGAGTVTLSVPATASGTTFPLYSYPGLTNITSQQAQSMFLTSRASGVLPLSQFTGCPGDATQTVVGILRTPDSGTRALFTSETGIGNEQSGSQVYMVYPADASGNGVTNGTTQITQLIASPATNFNGVPLAAGDYGFYTTGGSIAGMMGNTTVRSAGYVFISPLGISDATTAIGNGATPMTYNGVSYGAVSVQYGAYTLWSYEHMYQSATLAGTPLSLAQGIANQMLTSDAIIGGDLISNLHVQRNPLSVDGSLVY